MAEPMEVTITLDADVVERMLENPLTRGDDHGGREALSLDEFVNDAVRGYSNDREDYRKQFFFAGAQLGYPGYAEVYEREFAE